MPDVAVALESLLAQPYTLRLVRPGGGEVEGGGYRPRALSRGDWAAEGGTALCEVVFKFSGRAGPVAGWELVTAGGDVLDAGVFRDGPYDVQVIGSSIRVELGLEVQTGE
jgi:hypothetical protein